MKKQQVQFLEKQKNYYHYKKPTPKKYKKVVYQEESESEPEFEEEEEQVESESKQIEKEPEIKKAPSKKRTANSSNIYDYINKNAKRNKRKNTLGDTLNPINDARRSTAIDRTTSNYNDAKEKVQKIRDYSGAYGSCNSRNA